jgi:hypothetical protein
MARAVVFRWSRGQKRLTMKYRFAAATLLALSVTPVAAHAQPGDTACWIKWREVGGSDNFIEYCRQFVPSCERKWREAGGYSSADYQAFMKTCLPTVPSPPSNLWPAGQPPSNVWPGYERLARTPQAYAGWTLSFRGKVVQVMQDNGDTVLRVAVSPDGRNDVIYVEYRASASEPRILEGDFVGIRGKFVGIKSYKTVLGSTIQIPHAIACNVHTTIPDPPNVVRVPQQVVPCEPSG